MFFKYASNLMAIIGSVILFSLLYFIFLTYDPGPGWKVIILIVPFFGCWLSFMTGVVSLLNIVGLLISRRPFWFRLHHIVFRGWKIDIPSCAADKETTASSRTPAFLRTGSIFCFLVTALIVYSGIINVHNHWRREGTGTICGRDQDYLLIDGGQRMLAPFRTGSEELAKLPPILPGDEIEKHKGSLRYLLNGKIYADAGTIFCHEFRWKAILILFGLSCALSFLHCLCYPDILLEFIDSDLGH